MNRKKYKQRKEKLLEINRENLLKLLREEWDEIERAHEKKERREMLYHHTKEIGAVLAKSILVLAALGGTLAIAAVAPNIFAAIGRDSRQKRFFQAKEFKKTVARLKEKKLININHDRFIKLTPEGLARVAKITFNDLKIEKPKKWDGQWRIVIFDIPDRHEWSRDSFRKKLQEMGFLHLQKSVFVIPHPCLDEIKFLASFFNISSYIHFLETGAISNEEILKEHFDL